MFKIPKSQGANRRWVKAQEGQYASTVPNFVAISQTVAEIWRFFDFSSTAAVRHLGFVMRVFAPPTTGIWWSLSLYKIWS